MTDDQNVVPFPRRQPPQLTLFELEGIIFDAAYAIAANPSQRDYQFGVIATAALLARRECGDIAHAVETLMQTLMQD